jgi:hypothetical protein
VAVGNGLTKNTTEQYNTTGMGPSNDGSRNTFHGNADASSV